MNNPDQVFGRSDRNAKGHRRRRPCRIDCPRSSGTRAACSGNLGFPAQAHCATLCGLFSELPQIEQGQFSIFQGQNACSAGFAEPSVRRPSWTFPAVLISVSNTVRQGEPRLLEGRIGEPVAASHESCAAGNHRNLLPDMLLRYTNSLPAAPEYPLTPGRVEGILPRASSSTLPALLGKPAVTLGKHPIDKPLAGS